MRSVLESGALEFPRGEACGFQLVDTEASLEQLFQAARKAGIQYRFALPSVTSFRLSVVYLDSSAENSVGRLIQLRPSSFATGLSTLVTETWFRTLPFVSICENSSDQSFLLRLSL